MKLQSSLALLLAGVAVKAAPASLQFQNAEPTILQDLTAEDFQTIQHHFKETFDHATEHFSPPDAPVSNEDDESEVSIPNPFPHHPPPVIDFSHLTILEIINASLGHHHEEEHRKIEPRFRLFGGLDDPAKDPSRLPLHRLAWLVNFSSETQEYLKSDDITLLAPDDQALTPPHRRGGEHGHPHPHSEPMFFGADRHDLDKSHLAHPFHSKEFSPEKLHKLSGEDDDDKDKERKREIFRKIISYVGKYHVLPGRRQGHDLAEVSTAATLIEDSRVNVRPGFDFLPLPHPTLKFNYYSSKRGPTVLAKNGVIHLVSAPLFPPFTPLNELFLFPQYFSSLTSDIQKVDLADALLPSHDHGLEEEEEEESSSLVDELVDELIKEKGLKEFTVFAPGNFAFARVPAQILAGLHSPFPFAKKVLKYVLAGHVVPDTVFFSDFLKNATGSSSSVDKFFVSKEVDVQVPFEWLEDSPMFPMPALEQVAVKTKEWKMPSFPSRRGRAIPPPPPPPREHRDPQHCNANVTHYELPTLLTADNAKATLKVAVVSYRAGPGGKGPLKRSIVVFPQRPPHHGDEHEEVKTKMCPGHEDPFRPIKVTFSDLPAKSGAIHTLPRIIPPPPPPCHEDGGHKHFSETSLIKLSSKHEAKKLRKALALLF